MKLPTREFVITDAVRSAVPLWICNFGASGSGKTWTGLEEATGIQEVIGGDIYGIDTEGNRMLAYADYFKFKHVPMTAPYGSLDYLVAIQQIHKRGGRIIMVDSLSHEHENVGGMLDFQEQEVERMAGNDFGKRERVKMLAWQKPKAARRQLLNGMTALTDVAFILCFRANDISKPIKNAEGKTEVVHMGFTPVGGKEFVYEATVALYLPPASKGAPEWNSENTSERMMSKLPRQFEDVFKKNEQIGRAHGRKLAEWARGGAPAGKATKPSAPPASLPDRAAVLKSALSKAKTAEDLAALWTKGADLREALRAEHGEQLEELTLTRDARSDVLKEMENK